MVTVTEGFVAATTDGSFIRVDGVQTHVGPRYECRLVDKLGDASVFHIPRVISPGYRDVDGLPEHNMVPVEIRREVILKGYGVKKA